MRITTKPQGSTALFLLLVGIKISVLVMIRTWLGVLFFSLTLVQYWCNQEIDGSSSDLEGRS